ncbi:hypothetical protein AC578_10668 [Pseudocercospora eumusae]|uniref:Uncharacterized protein n=1 Tax=Pseudocercospora eumusae TaxID=321146 RepID=A0A139HJM5_9PEZI|nr:hypothetical protein AC578_10668 [Pseudocercospora eumusae]
MTDLTVLDIINVVAPRWHCRCMNGLVCPHAVEDNNVVASALTVDFMADLLPTRRSGPDVENVATRIRSTAHVAAG